MVSKKYVAMLGLLGMAHGVFAQNTNTTTNTTTTTPTTNNTHANSDSALLSPDAADMR